MFPCQGIIGCKVMYVIMMKKAGKLPGESEKVVD